MEQRKQTVQFKFIVPLNKYEKEKPYAFNVDAEDVNVPKDKQTNIEYSTHEVEVTDVRGNEKSLSLDDQSFIFLHHAESVPNTTDISQFPINEYCNSMSTIVRGMLGADAVYCYDIRFRRNGLDFGEYLKSSDFSRNLKAPTVHVAHIDHTKLSGFDRMKRHLTQPEINEYLSGRYRARIINLWRPLRRPIQDCPLAFCDPRSLQETDLLASDRVTPEYAFELYDIKFNSAQKWYWLSEQAPEEIAVFLQFDSECSKPGKHINTTPHAAFENPLAPTNAFPRESVEVRVMAFDLIEAEV